MSSTSLLERACEDAATRRKILNGASGVSPEGDQSVEIAPAAPDLLPLLTDLRDTAARLVTVLSLIQPTAALRSAEPLDQIRIHVEEAYSLAPESTFCHSREERIFTPRSVAIYLMRSITSYPLAVISRYWGFRHSSSVAYAYRVIRERMEVYPEFSELVGRLSQVIERQFAAQAQPPNES